MVMDRFGKNSDCRIQIIDLRIKISIFIDKAL
jgi:hypothetical protein